MVDAIFALHRIASAIISGRAQTFLNIFAEADVFLLHFIAEGNGTLDALLVFLGSDVVEEPLENGECCFVSERDDHICGDVVGINVEHEVGKNPEIQGLLQASAGSVKAIAGVFRLCRTNGRELLGIVAERVRAVLRVINFLHQAGMRDGDVVALEVIVDVNLPVAIDDVVAALGRFQAVELEAARLLGDFSQIDGEWLRLKIEIDENELAPGFAAQRHHAHSAAIEKLDAIDVRSANEAAVESVGPAVVLAAQDIFAAAAERDRARAMAAHVAEGAQLALLVAHDDDRLADNIHRKKTFWVGNRTLGSVHFATGLMQRSDELPGALKDARFFNFQNRSIRVEARCERLRAFDLLVHIEME